MHAHDDHHHRHHTAGERIGWAFGLNAGFTVIEFIGGWLTNSTAIIADAVHDLGDTLAIASAWYLDRKAGREADERFTYGYRRLSLFGALINGIVLIVGSILVLIHTVPRLFDPVLPHVPGMIGLALLGIAANGYAVIKLRKGRSLNEKVLNWHLLEDVLGWVAVLLVSVTLLFVDLPILDPLLAIVFTAFILVNVVKTLKETVKIFFQAVPEELLTVKIHQELMTLDEIAQIHHEHCWSLDGEHHVYTAHLLLKAVIDQAQQKQLKDRIAEKLKPYRLTHTTIELEFPDESCRDQGPMP